MMLRGNPWVTGAVLLTIAPVAMAISAFALEHVIGTVPCSLCLLQRVMLIPIGVGGALCLMLTRVRCVRKAPWVLAIMGASAGIGIASRHLYLQAIGPDRAPACGPAMDVLFDILPWRDFVSAILSGDGHCAEVAWRFLGLTIPGWSMVGFVACAICAGFMLLKPRPVSP